VSPPPQITQSHLDRWAIPYGRQSTKVQYETNTGSRDYQLGQARYPQLWGWAESHIKWLDDFGLSGVAAEHRPGYKQLRQWIREGKVGLVCVADHSRLGRNAAEWLEFYAECAVRDVLIAIDGKISNPKDSNDWLHAALLAVLSQHGGLNIRDTLQRGRVAKLEKGIAVSFPPVGFDQRKRNKQKEWVITRDTAVRSAIATVFRVFFQKRTLHATMMELIRLGVQIPRRKPGHAIRWRTPRTDILAVILSNPHYGPDYYYRRHVDDPTKGRSAKGRRRVRKAAPEEVKILRDHHVGYLSRDQLDEIRTIFRQNSWTTDHAPLGEGVGLVQGLPRCALHRHHKMKVHYKHGKEAGPRSHHYGCRGEWESGGSKCGRVPGGPLDDAVERAVLARLAPPSMAALRRAFDEATADSRAERRRREVERARLRQRQADLEEKLDAVGSENRHAVKRLAGQLEDCRSSLLALDEVDERVRSLANQEDAATLAEAEALAVDVERIWNAPTTEIKDKKRIVRTMVRSLEVVEWWTEHVRVRLRWVDDAPDEMLTVWRWEGVVRLVADMEGQGMSPEAIATTLKEMGIRTRRGRMWDGKTVRQFCWRMRRRESNSTA
jgi:DNA invertase Pin-like site-specific DNA recombinase